MSIATPRAPVNLDNCDREPIHIPGQIQPHGAMLAFDKERRLVHASANAAALLGPDQPALGDALLRRHFDADADIHAAFDDGFEALAAGESLPLSIPIAIGERSFDLILHGSKGLLLAEYELRQRSEDMLDGFASKAHRAMDRLKRQRSLDSLLTTATHEIRQLTGFDRVMAYRFRSDGSGDVVAENCDASLDPFLGRRYPASDIPAQARRLYVENTLRLIADIGGAPVDVLATPEAAGVPLDMSHAVLRAVSPIHIEYLTNMGVGASMSVSIVVHGELWGMIACHHMAPRQVPYSVRMACDVVAQILAANVQTVTARDHAARMASAATIRASVMEGALHADDPTTAFIALGQPLMEIFDAHALIVADGSKLAVEGDMPVEAARALVRWLNDTDSDAPGNMVNLSALAQFPPQLQSELGYWCGVLGLRFDAASHSWLVLVRKEQIESILWGGKPEKEYAVGPLGPRLTPRGSFAIWRETVRGRAVEWDATTLDIGRQLLDELMRANAARVAELNRARNQLLAILGHDLRDPLHSISMAARVLEKSSGDSQGRLGQRIQSSSSRMQRLVSQVLDMSRLQGGLGLGLNIVPTDLVALVNDLLDESLLAHPGSLFKRELPERLIAQVDPDRTAQVVTNLVSNARHHGGAGEPIVVRLSQEGDEVHLAVSNVGSPIPPELETVLFNPFKRQSLGNERNKSGLGLGLYIANEIVTAHRGSIGYSFDKPHVVFTVRLPQQTPDASSGG
ncbi:ATP-binding protein [Xylophilus sp. Leaf220]|uniref:ATP-binding protein n=1 Tax=Xylophilus sp. Leaf220 TaxID=1735686 RepID=UPI000701ED1C|nr:ATP-binding protein [Xylophilus sp. Leaf220]KQM68343.1 histidine kinase [Xylophilus sp. Leaf220]